MELTQLFHQIFLLVCLAPTKSETAQVSNSRYSPIEYPCGPHQQSCVGHFPVTSFKVFSIVGVMGFPNKVGQEAFSNNMYGCIKNLMDV